ncbi:chemotaxis protein CheB [Mucilaginibacter paludis]|uniref:protein-glutamate methylesterase n=1 Tax=Mucilaginibacter paludis DSM 18603 TaxID=714943 RepID=H1YBB6_9SPHI|nr:chemotaxis protein CheB [Mucilaginibacter paludis]EHQ31170.1 CheB methylesterase [Mucilaginibacter paludis DSM 18603]
MEENVLNTQCIIIGGSAGSLEVMMFILTRLETNFSIPIIIVLHRKYNHDSALIEVLSHKTKLHVKEAEDKEQIKPGVIYIAPADYHLLVESNHSFSLDCSEKVQFSRPSIDVSFQTAAEAYGPGLLAILLSGANADGTEGFMHVRRNGGVLIAQNPSDALVPFMPQSAINEGLADFVLNRQEISKLLNYQQDNKNSNSD